MAYNYLQVKKKSWQQFKEEWLHDAFALNMVGIFIWARAYHKHVTVFFGYNYWTSHIDHDLNKVNIFLLYRGNNRFDETCMIGGMEYQERYNEFAHKARKIDRYFAKERAEKEKKEKEIKQQQEQQSGSEESKDSYNDDDEKSDNPDKLDIEMECMMEIEEESDNMQKKTQDGQSNKDVNVWKNEEKQSSNQTDSLQEAKRDVNVQKKSSLPAASKQDSDETQTEDVSKEKVIKNEGNASTSTSITAGKLVNKAKARIKGTWHFAKKRQKIDIKARTCKLCGLVKETLKKLEKHMRKKHKKFKYKSILR